MPSTDLAEKLLSRSRSKGTPPVVGKQLFKFLFCSIDGAGRCNISGRFLGLQTGGDELTIRAVGKAIALLAVYGTAFVCVWLVYLSYRHSSVSTINVSQLSDLDEAFEVGNSSLRVRSPEFLKMCFAGDYVYALKDAKQWFAPMKPSSRQRLKQLAGRLTPSTTMNILR